MLLLLTIVPLSTTAVEKSAFINTIYVDDSGGADYTSIQEAINNAEEGATVYVYMGTYYENIFINKTLSLIGEKRNITNNSTSCCH